MVALATQPSWLEHRPVSEGMWVQSSPGKYGRKPIAVSFSPFLFSLKAMKNKCPQVRIKNKGQNYKLCYVWLPQLFKRERRREEGRKKKKTMAQRNEKYRPTGGIEGRIQTPFGQIWSQGPLPSRAPRGTPPPHLTP